MKGQVFRSIPEAIHHTYADHPDKKTLSADLDYSPSNLSQRTNLAEDPQYPFPATDRLIRLQELTGDFSILLTMADRLGFEVHPKRDHLPEILRGIQETQQELGRKIQQLELTVPISATVGKKNR